ncbi:MAG: selenide, water dikinase SelD [Acidobacteriales bacterium]|nr:selenide, water dikinase SelD [Terriglobales bacterium]
MLGKLARQHDPNVLVGFDKADDAGVYQISPDTALVQTVDFFTPIVDDPYTFGQIAAVNALSDVYAMGGRPLSSLALVCFPEKGDLAVLEQILAGGLSKMMEAGCTVVGGHSIRDPEIKFGYSVTGSIHPERVLTNAGARAGDELLLTKPLGTGVISTAIKRQRAEQAWIDGAVKSMTTLNRAAADVITAPEWQGHVHGMTDVTGFGLIGHAREVALASGVSLEIHAGKVPFLTGALECVRAGYVPGGLNANREFAECVVEYKVDIPAEVKTMLFDPQTAGGLLISVEGARAPELQSALRRAGVPAEQIGRVNPKAAKLIQVVGRLAVPNLSRSPNIL